MNFTIRGYGVCALVLASGFLIAPAVAEVASNGTFDPIITEIHHYQYAAAIDNLRDYLGRNTAGPNDTNVVQAKHLLLQATNEYSAGLEKAGEIARSARVLLDTAAIPAMSDRAEEFRGRARISLQQAFKTMMARKDPAAFVVADLFATGFPTEPPLIDKAESLRLQIANLAAAKATARPTFLLSEYVRLKSAGATDEQFTAAKVTEAELAARDAEDLFARGWFLHAAGAAQMQLALGTPPPEITTRLQKVTERALSGYYDAAIAFGNGKMVTDAAALYANPANPAAEPGKITRMQGTVKSIGDKVDYKHLIFASKYIDGKVTWADGGTGYMVPEPGVIGIDDGQDKAVGEVTVEAGMFLTGGTLHIANGKITFAGTPAKPIVLQDMKIECELHGTVIASNTLFINCSFTKAGGWFSTFSSKWQFDDCLLAKSDFKGLSKTDYGLAFQRCTFVHDHFPDRPMSDETGKDNTKLYMNKWNTLTDCQYYHCDLEPGLLWANGKSAFIDCTVRSGTQFSSTKPIDVEFFIPADDTVFFNAIRENTRIGGIGGINYKPTPTNVARLAPSPLWRLVPDISDADDNKAR